jgi:hypothetical protein
MVGNNRHARTWGAIFLGERVLITHAGTESCTSPHGEDALPSGESPQHPSWEPTRDMCTIRLVIVGSNLE